MQNASLIKWFAGLTALIFVAVAVQNIWKLNAPEAAPPAPAFAKAPDYSASYQPPAPRAARPKPKPEADDAGLPRLPREKVEAWLAKHNRNAMSLLAAFRALDDTNYLNEAATNFPNDPHVELAVLARNAFPEERRKWLDLFKASSPSNSLANYFSAQEYFRSGQTDEAVQELLAASGKAQFDNHAMETQLDAEQLYLDSGKSPTDAATFALSSMAKDDLPELATIKRVAGDIRDLMQQKSGAGDADSVANLAQMGLQIADKLNAGDSGKYLVNQLVGMATESIVLRQLDQNTSYDFLDGQTPAQVLQQLKDQKKSYTELARNFSAAEPNLTEGERASYLQRWKIYGELEAIKWVVQQHPPNPQ